MPKTPKPPPTFDNEELSENKVVKTWKERGFEDMALLTLSQKFLAACAQQGCQTPNHLLLVVH